MNTTSHQLKLDTGVVLHLRHAVGTRIAVTTGCAWITQEDDIRDIVLSPGMNFLLDRPGLALVQMLKRGEVCIDFIDSQRPHRADLIQTSMPRRHGTTRTGLAAVFPG